MCSSETLRFFDLLCGKKETWAGSVPGGSCLAPQGTESSSPPLGPGLQSGREGRSGLPYPLQEDVTRTEAFTSQEDPPGEYWLLKGPDPKVPELKGRTRNSGDGGALKDRTVFGETTCHIPSWLLGGTIGCCSPSTRALDGFLQSRKIT